ncbi:MAG: enoyl-CoA hydratase [Proteobacteria bacterium]|nr:MAG: enoyl-CoA hydratase [Pseudomonadota bacterium]
MDHVIREDRGAIAHLTLNRPDRLNALSDGMLAALKARLEDLAQDDTIRVVVLKGAGKLFCAGHDLKEMQAVRAADDGGAEAWRDLFERCAEVMLMVQNLPQPVIAQVHGIATAAGCQLAATCDMVVAADSARFGVNGVNIGLFCSTPMVALTRAVPRKMAFEMLTTGRFLMANEAKEIGLVNRVTHEDQLDDETQALAETVASKLGAAVKIGKGAFYAQAEMDIAQAYAFAGDAMARNMGLADTDEGIRAFLEKRAPEWRQ